MYEILYVKTICDNIMRERERERREKKRGKFLFSKLILANLLKIANIAIIILLI